jgi:hypothetical protein
MKITKHFTFNVFIENVEGAYIAHCLEAGLVATSKDIDELPHKMAKMLIRQIEFSLRNNNPADIFNPAANDVWERFFSAQAKLETTQKSVHVENRGNIVLDQHSYAAAPAC